MQRLALWIIPADPSSSRGCSRPRSIAATYPAAERMAWPLQSRLNFVFFRPQEREWQRRQRRIRRAPRLVNAGAGVRPNCSLARNQFFGTNCSQRTSVQAAVALGEFGHQVGACAADTISVAFTSKWNY